MKFKNKTILITGSNRGIGYALAERFAQENSHLILTMRKVDSEIEKHMLSKGAASVKLIELDLSQPEKIDQFLADAAKLKIDVLVNNAGLLTGGLLEKQKMSEIYQMMQVNLLAVIHLTHGLLPHLMKQPEALIINNASVTAIMHFPCATTYAASKAAIIAFTDCLKTELRGTSVQTLVMITPGVKTRMFDEIPKLYGDNLELSMLESFVTPEQWSDDVVKAAQAGASLALPPSPITQFGIGIAQHFPKLFSGLINKKFRRA
jgi:short-subunit dehydrogenase